MGQFFSEQNELLMHSTDLKVALCGIQVMEADKTGITFDFNRFGELIDSFSKELSQIEEYKTHLWLFGHCLYQDKKDFEQFPKFQEAIDLLEKFRFLLVNQDAKINITNRGAITEIISLDNERYVSAIQKELKREIEEKEINKFLCARVNGIEVIVNDRESLDNNTDTFTESFSLYRIDLLEKKIEQLKYWKEKDGEDKRRKPVKKAVHMGIHALSFLLRIDEFYAKRKLLDSIEDVTLSNKMCRFIADFLLFFKIYDQDDFTDMSKPYSTIRNLYNEPPKKAAPLVYTNILNIRNTLNICIKKQK